MTDYELLRFEDGKLKLIELFDDSGRHVKLPEPIIIENGGEK